MKTPKMPKQTVQEQVLPEVVDESKKTDAERDRLNRRRGRASTILSGMGEYRATAGKSLLGE